MPSLRGNPTPSLRGNPTPSLRGNPTPSRARSGWRPSLWSLVAAATLSPGVGRAEPTASDLARAEALFRAGREKMSDQKYAEACPKFAESQRLDPGPGTLVNLARCHQLEGRLATAWAEYSEFLALPRGESKKWADWERTAREGLAALTPALSRLVVEVPPAVARLEGLRVTRDEASLSAAEWGVAVPVDPGPHVVSVRADGRRPWSLTVTIGAEADRKVVQVPPLAEAPVAPPASASAAPTASSPPPLAPASARPALEAPVEPASTTRRTLGFVAGGVGLVGLGVGSLFALRASSRWSDARDACPERACPVPLGVTRRDEAVRAANLANVGFGVALLGLGAGAYLLLTGRSSDPPRTTRVLPALAPGLAGLAVSGSL